MGKMKIYIGLLVLVFLGILLFSGEEAKPIDWRKTYSVYDKIPFGMYVFDHEIEGLTGHKVLKLNETFYELLDSAYDYEARQYRMHANLMTISGDENLDGESLKEVFYFVSHGNTAFISCESFPQIFEDSLKVTADRNFQFLDPPRLSLANPAFGKKEYAMEEGIKPVYFSSIDTANTTVLGYMADDSLRVNFIRVKYRSGEFLLHTAPAAFTNIHLLKPEDHRYAENVLSYLPDTNLYWYARRLGDDGLSSSPLRFILSQPALKWAWFLFLFGMLAFMFFNARRKQRVVAILEPLPNTTVEFAKTIGNLYYQEGEYRTVIDRKIVYFLERLRNDYLIDTAKLDEAFVHKLQLKSGKKKEDIEWAVILIAEHRRNPYDATEHDLIQLNSALEKILN